MIEISKFPTAAKVKELSEKRAQDNHEKALQNIFENSIEPAIKNGQVYCEFNAWDVPETAIEFLKTKGYTVDDVYRNTRGSYVLIWGDFDAKTLYPNDIPTDAPVEVTPA